MLGVMTDAAANDSLSFWASTSPELTGPSVSLRSRLCDWLLFFKHWLPLFVQSGVDGDDFTSSTPDQQDTLQSFC